MIKYKLPKIDKTPQCNELINADCAIKQLEENSDFTRTQMSKKRKKHFGNNLSTTTHQAFGKIVNPPFIQCKVT